MVREEAGDRIARRKARDREARRERIVGAARRIAEHEGWASVTVRRLSDEIAYSQPVLYSHFESREGILAAVALEGFRELGPALEKARSSGSRGKAIERVAGAYLKFAESSPALYEVMFTLGLTVPFGDAATPVELRSAFSKLVQLFEGRKAKPEIVAELFWASLHGIAELTRTRRFPPAWQKERLRVLVALFTRLQ